MSRNNQNNLLPTKRNYNNTNKLNEKILKIRFADKDNTLVFGVDMHYGKQHKKNLNVHDQFLNALLMLIIVIKLFGSSMPTWK